ncbi:thiamine diphosphokinase [Candidatus Neomarinimicrobiota bacterium]
MMQSANSIIILANGSFPNHSYPEKILQNIKPIICTDGSADKLIESGITPQYIIGDMDSLNKPIYSYHSKMIEISNQNNTDLEKAIEWCISNNFKIIQILGAVGLRDDHGLSNFMLLAKFYNRADISIITDFSTIICMSGDKTFETYPGQNISIVAIETVQSITTHGLTFTLNDEKLKPGSRGISNSAISNEMTIQTSGKILIFFAHKS